MVEYLVDTEADDAFDGGDIVAETLDGGGLSFREALALAALSDGQDSIRFDESVGTIELDGAFLTIDSDLRINGDTNRDGQADVTVASTWESLPVLRVTEGTTATIESLIVTGGEGRLQGGATGASGERGEDGTGLRGAYGGAGTDAEAGIGSGAQADGGWGGRGGDAYASARDFESVDAWGGAGGRGGDGGLGGDGGRGGDGGDARNDSFFEFRSTERGGFGGEGGDGGFGGGHGGNGGLSGLSLNGDPYQSSSRDGDGGDGGDAVGGIWVEGDLTLLRSEVFGTRAIGGNGGDGSQDGSVPTLAQKGQHGDGGDAAGAIYVGDAGSLTVRDSSFSSTGVGVRTGNTAIAGISGTGDPFVSGIPGADGEVYSAIRGTFDAQTALVGNPDATVNASEDAELYTQLIYVYADETQVNRGDTLTIHVNRLGDLSRSKTVQWTLTLEDNSGSFLDQLGTVTLDPGERSAAIEIESRTPTIVDFTETFRVDFRETQSAGTLVVEGALLAPVGVVEGTDADDSLLLTASDETVHAGDGNDVIAGRGGQDVIFGGAGDDTIGGGAGSDLILGDAGDDTFYGHREAFDSYYGGADTDTIRYDSITSETTLSADLYKGVVLVGRYDQDSIHSIERFVAGQGNDKVLADTTGSEIDGQGGRDRLIGRQGDDRLIDGAGKDNLFGNRGSDTFVLVADGDADSIKDFEIGIDLIDLSAWGASGLADLEILKHRSGKLILFHEDEALAVRTRGVETEVSEVSEDWFVFA